MKQFSLHIRSLLVMLMLLAGSQGGFAAGAGSASLEMDSRSIVPQQVTETARRVGVWKKWRANRKEKKGEKEYEIFATLSALMGVPGFIMIIRGFSGLFTSSIMFPLALLLLLSGLAFGIIAARHPRWKRKPLFNLLNAIGLSLSTLGTVAVALFFLQIILILFGARIRLFPFF